MRFSSDSGASWSLGSPGVESGHLNSVACQELSGKLSCLIGGTAANGSGDNNAPLVYLGSYSQPNWQWNLQSGDPLQSPEEGEIFGLSF